MPTRTVLRRLAAYVLVVWLFALGSGVVNACVVSGELRHGAFAAALHDGHDMAGQQMADADMADHDMAAHGMSAHEMAGDPAQDHQARHEKPPCERLCDAPAAARLADKELSSTPSGFWLAPAPLPTVTLRVAPPAAHAAPASEQPWRATVPLSIAFQRLTL